MAAYSCKCIWLFSAGFLFLSITAVKGESLRKRLFNITLPQRCQMGQFECMNGEMCRPRVDLCNNRYNCKDQSDENYCNTNGRCPSYRPFECKLNGYGYSKCIPLYWVCDGNQDCPSGEDEKNCSGRYNVTTALPFAKYKAESNLLGMRRTGRPVRRWGPEASRMATALFLSNSTELLNDTTLMSELTYEITVEVLARLALKTIDDVSSTELATFLHALLVTCVNPRDFFGVDLVSELRKQADRTNYSSPFVMLALCNAGERITEGDVENMIRVFWKANSEHWTDTQALAVLALSCAASQEPGPDIDPKEVQALAMELKTKQYRNGTVENLKTTALVMQAILSSDPESDEENFDEEKALRRILDAQSEDGSFGNFANTYYVLPVLAGRSLGNVTAKHCNYTRKDENEAYRDLLNQVGDTWRVRLSLWFGDNRTVERTLSLRIPANTSLYGGMEYAADIDGRYRFEYTMRNGKPYVYSISGTQDDPENQIFWYLWTFQSNSNLTMVEETKSPAAITPEDGQHFVYWYKHRSWTTEDQSEKKN